MQSSVFYTEKGNMINVWSCNCETSTLSTTPYKAEFQGFKQEAPVPTYEEAVKWLESIEDTDIMKDSVFLTKGNYYTNLNECTEALRKLILLRDYYNEGWQPDWKEKSSKYCIDIFSEDIAYKDFIWTSKVLAFKTSKIRDKFLEEQKELIEIAKPLL